MDIFKMVKLVKCMVKLIICTFCAGVESFTFYRKSGSKWATRRLNEPLYLDFSKAAQFWAAFNFKFFVKSYFVYVVFWNVLEGDVLFYPVITCFVLILILYLLFFVMYLLLFAQYLLLFALYLLLFSLYLLPCTLCLLFFVL